MKAMFFGLLIFVAGCGSVEVVPSGARQPKVAAPEQSSGGEGSRVRFIAPSRASLVGPDGKTVCQGPCETTVRPGSDTTDTGAADERLFQVRVDGAPSSPSFALPQRAEVSIAARCAPPVLPPLAIVTGTTGAMVTGIGGFLVIADLQSDASFDGAVTGGLVTMALGSIALSAGIVMGLLSGTHIEIAEAGTLRF